MRVFSNRFIWAALLLAILMQGCSSDKANEAAYFKTFDHIKTDQFVWSYGDGGIYWVSENEVVLDAQVKNKQGIFENGLYQVNVVDGSFIRLVERSISYSYCFDGDTLFIKSADKRKLLRKPEFYSIEQVTKFKKLKNGQNSPLRCRGFEKPKNDGGYLALRTSDGYIKNKYRKSKDDEVHVYLADNNGLEIKELVKHEKDSNGLVGRLLFIQDKDAYFGYKMKARCASFWWLYRDGWETKTKKHCFGGWAQNTSKLIYPTRVGMFVQHYTSKKYKSYLVTDTKEYSLETISSIGGALSPDGCRVAYGSGELSGKGGRRQILKIFNACQFMEEQGE